MTKKNRLADSLWGKMAIWEWIFLAVMVVGVFLLRTVGQLDQVFVNGQVWLREVDPYYYMRMVDNLMVNYPVALTWDMYIAYPSGSTIAFHPFLPLLIATLGKLGLNPEIVAAFIPPIFGALLMIPLYFIGKIALNRRGIGILACILAALLPTELYHRSLLGFTDHHILEAFFSTSTLLLLFIAIRKGKGWLWPILSGLALALYNLSWHGGLFLMLILILWFLVEFTYRFHKEEDVKPLCKIFAIAFGICALIMVPFLFLRHAGLSYSLVFIGVTVVAGGLGLLSSRLKDRVSLLLTIFVSTGVAVLLLGVIYPNILYFAIDALRTVFVGYGSPISETGATTVEIAAHSYGISFLLAFGGLYFAFRQKRIMVLVWSVVILAAAIGQRKWGYYLIIDIALLTPLFLFELTDRVVKNVKPVALGICALFLILPTIKSTIGIASLPNNINQDWMDATAWMQDSTPDQFGIYLEGDPNTKFSDFPGSTTTPETRIFPKDQYLIEHPYYAQESHETVRYGILTWWDYGHWIIRNAHRVPSSNNAFWGASGIFRFYASIKPEEAEDWIKAYNIKYIIVSRDLVSNIVRGRDGQPVETFGKLSTVMDICNIKIEDVGNLMSTMAYRLYWGKDVPDIYQLIYNNNTVKIYERNVD